MTGVDSAAACGRCDGRSRPAERQGGRRIGKGTDHRRYVAAGRPVVGQARERGKLVEQEAHHWSDYPALEPWVKENMELVSEQSKNPPLASRGYGLVSVAMYDAIVATANELGMEVIGHIPNALSPEYVLDAGQHMIAHTEEVLKHAGDDYSDDSKRRREEYGPLWLNEVPSEGDVVLARELRRAYPRAPAERMILRHHQHHLVLEERRQLDRRIVLQPVDQRLGVKKADASDAQPPCTQRPPPRKGEGSPQLVTAAAHACRLHPLPCGPELSHDDRIRIASARAIGCFPSLSSATFSRVQPVVAKSGN